MLASVCGCSLQGVYTPSIIANNNIQVYKGGIGNISNTMYSGLNTTLYGYREAAYAGELSRLTPQDWSTLNSTITTAARANRALINGTVSQTGTAPVYLTTACITSTSPVQCMS